MQHLELLVAHRIGRGAGRRLHRQDAQQLQHVILHHVAQRAGLVIEPAAPPDSELLGHGDLHVADAATAPHRLEQRVAEAQRQQVLHRLLAEVVIDAIDLLLAETLRHLLIDALRRSAIGPEWLLQNDAGIGRHHLRGSHVGGRGDIKARRGRQEPDPQLRVAIGNPGLELPEVLDARRIKLLIIQAGGKFAPAFVAEPTIPQMLAAVRERALHIGLAIHDTARGGENARACVKLPGNETLVQRRQELAHGQIARSPQQDQFKRVEELQN